MDGRQRIVVEYGRSIVYVVSMVATAMVYGSIVSAFGIVRCVGNKEFKSG